MRHTFTGKRRTARLRIVCLDQALTSETAFAKGVLERNSKRQIHIREVFPAGAFSFKRHDAVVDIYDIYDRRNVTVKTCILNLQQKKPNLTMYRSFFSNALFALSLPLPFAASQLIGSINYVTNDLDGLLAVTIENQSEGNYSMLARNNLFDNQNPYRPLQVKNQAGAAVALIGEQYAYGELNDEAFMTFPPGAIWQREFNMSEYIPPDATITKAYSECFVVTMPPDGLFGINTTNIQAGEALANLYLNQPLDDIFISTIPLHLNITVQPGVPGSAASAATASIPTQAAATEVLGSLTMSAGQPAQTAGTSIDQFLSSDLLSGSGALD
ncbi:hypothetical protein MMC28_007318 [Mycoblastus sanguinarius]|nr:hypothetical protein [Mycoblastus sanguinarius]